MFPDDLSEERLREVWVNHRKSSTEQAQDAIAQDVPTQQTLDPTLNEDQEVSPDPQEVSPDPPEVTEESRDLYEGFSEDPFVKAAAMFREHEYLGIIELLTEAVETGKFGGDE